MWFIGVEVEQETSASPPKKNPGSAPDIAAPRHNNALIRCLSNRRTARRIKGKHYTEEAIVTKIHVSLFLRSVHERRGIHKNVDCRRGVWTMRGVCTRKMI